MRTLSVEETKELKALCRAGRLYDIEKIVLKCGTLSPHPDVRRKPLDVALEKGFHSLIELLIRHTNDTAVKNQALEQAVRKARFDVVQMLVDNGADPLSVAFEDVLCSYQSDMARYFIAKGADLLRDNPFTTAFRFKIRPMLGVYLEVCREFPDLKEALQRQLDMALCYHCKTGSMKWVCLLIWAGGNPLTSVPDIESPEYMDDREMWTTAVEEASLNGHIDIIKKIGVQSGNKVWQEALYSACSFGKNPIVQFILQSGVAPNDKPNGGSSGLEAAMRHIDWGASMSRLFPYYGCSAGESIETVRLMLQRGARWMPNDQTDLNAVRRSLYGVDKYYTVALVKLLIEHKACDAELLRRFVATPKMTDYLGGRAETEKLLRRAK